ncbi:tyrosine-type recombinase/integrase [Nitratireductor sp. B36]|uniref:tyrosine-type recombinase/integrase n=1 Tax=Nitratireductor sp. B36 TaxID=2762059 RepID=UPI001E5FE377|nr:tyrosine-type recombinase/integrase [Nitratireductor sp. B36]MCC5780512.1 tyrosine-type recombinase/integrase [Nitratireductor sp. B36]
MPITERGGGYQVTVNRASAKAGYRRIRRQVQSLCEAESLETEINEALDVYGKWPVEEGDKPLPVPTLHGRSTRTQAILTPTGQTGTLRKAAEIAIETHWKGMRSETQTGYTLMSDVAFLEQRGKRDIDQIVSEDIDALVAHHREKGHSASYINQALGHIRKVNQIALKRLPPLCTTVIPITKQKARNKKTWWLRPEDHQQVSEWLRRPGGDPLFADLIDIIVYEGLRVEEALRLTEGCFTGLAGNKPWLHPDGTKTADSDNAVPVYPEALPVIKRSIARAKANRWERLFPISPRQAMSRWNTVREFLGASHIPTATMKSLRRTFAWYANSRGMPTATLQKVLRHRTITTTSGYLNLVGAGELEDSRKYFSKDSTQHHTVPSPSGNSVGEIIKAYAQTPGVTPEDVARFAKELMG